MIVGLEKAILHILDGMSGITMYSDDLLDVSDASVNNFITTHVEKSYDDPGIRSGEFKENSGILYHIKQYKSGGEEFVEMSKYIAERMYDGIAASEEPESCDVIIAHCVLSEKPVLAVLKCDNKIGFTHRVDHEESGIKNSIINHYAILPALAQRINECAFISLDDMSIKYKGKKRKIDGESMDLIADVLLECVYDISPKESINAITKIAKTVTKEYGGDTIETASKMKEYITENFEEIEYVEPQKVAEKVFEGRPAMQDEFISKIREAEVPEKVELNKYVTKKLSSNIKMVTDIGVEISFPAEFYRDSEHIEIINNDDGTISVRINNIGEITNK
ncbi:MAG: nucleoid-associated protein [bacterium]|nr:nucleoid-associated protein [bacterium]